MRYLLEVKGINENILKLPVLTVTQLEITYKFLLYYCLFKFFFQDTVTRNDSPVSVLFSFRKRAGGDK